jgi:hypothetical protein
VTFSEKLDMLLNITNTPNNLLAKVLSLDPSYISRIRHGRRNILGGDYIEKIADFFSHRCMKEYILSALAAAMENKEIETVKTEEELKERLKTWLTDEYSKSGGVKNLFKDFAQISNEETAKKTAADRERSAAENSNLMMFYGNVGRRQATLSLFNRMLSNEKPGMLLMFSDENSKWMKESEEFEREWETLLWQLILKGNKIKVIHKVSHDIDEMMEVVHRWLPLYVSGAVEPYYYPRLRDGIYKRTLTVAPGCAAVFATSIGESGENTPNFMATDKLTVDSFTNEFFSYLTLCRPLMKISTAKRSEEVLAKLYEFITSDGPLTIQGNSIGMMTLPIGLINDINCGKEVKQRLLERQELWSRRFEEKLKKDEVYHIIRLHDIADLKKGRACIRFISEDDKLALYYTTETYKEHLKNIYRLMKENENYHVLVTANGENRFSVYCNENEVRIFKDDEPALIFEITEQNMVSAFGDYFEQEIILGYSERTRKRMQKIIEDLIYFL